MTDILVYLDALHDVSMELRRSVRDMDECVRRAYNDVQGMRDNGRGLNEVRQRAADLLRAHRAIEEAGLRLERYVTTQAETFAQTDQELATMVRIHQFAPLASFLYQQQRAYGAHTSRIVDGVVAEMAAWVRTQVTRIDVASLAQRYVQMSATAVTLAQGLRQLPDDLYARMVNDTAHTMGNAVAAASHLVAVAQLLSGFVPSVQSPRMRYTAPVGAGGGYQPQEVMSQYAYTLATGSLRLWHVTSLECAALAYVYDADRQHVMQRSSGVQQIGANDGRALIDTLQHAYLMPQDNSPMWHDAFEYLIHDTASSPIMQRAYQLYGQLVAQP